MEANELLHLYCVIVIVSRSVRELYDVYFFTGASLHDWVCDAA